VREFRDRVDPLDSAEHMDVRVRVNGGIAERNSVARALIAAVEGRETNVAPIKRA
jgi:hypothetical protein